MDEFTIGRNEKSEIVGLIFLALCCIAFGFGVGRLLVLYGFWDQFIKIIH
jgi:hypothetical protein